MFLHLNLFKKLWHKMLKFPIPVLNDLVKKNREKVAINFSQFIMDGDGKIHLGS